MRVRGVTSQLQVYGIRVANKKLNSIRIRLLRNARPLTVTSQSHPTNWLLSSTQGRLSKRNANKFLLGSILDYQIPGDLAWENTRRLAEEIFDDPVDLWEQITSIPRSNWKNKWRKYNLHRFPAAHDRVWRIGKEIVLHYNGDAREIWKNQTSDIALQRLRDLRVGKQLSRMIVGSLIDAGHVHGTGDIKVDRHIRRSLGRLLIGRGFSEREADEVTKVTRRMYPSNPWVLDWPLYLLATEICIIHKPKCAKCEFRKYCRYFRRHQGRNR